MHIVVYVSVPTRRAAQVIAQLLLTKKLAACVAVIPAVESFFWWQKKIDRAGELLLVIKTKKVLFGKLAKAVASKHPYRVPEIIALPIVAGNKPYLDWIDESCR